MEVVSYLHTHQFSHCCHSDSSLAGIGSVCARTCNHCDTTFQPIGETGKHNLYASGLSCMCFMSILGSSPRSVGI